MRQYVVKAAMAAPDTTKAIIFDCFGVLYIDSEQSLLAQVPEHNENELRDIFLGNNYGYYSRDEYLERIAALTGLSIKKVAHLLAREHHINSDLVRLIKEKVRPHYKVGLLSNIGRGWIEDYFSRHQLHDLFDEVVLSGEERVAKPHPAIFEVMASRLSVPVSECLMIDDIVENCDGALRAGMNTLHYRNNAQLINDLRLHHILT